MHGYTPYRNPAPSSPAHSKSPAEEICSGHVRVFVRAVGFIAGRGSVQASAATVRLATVASGVATGTMVEPRHDW